MKEYRVEFISEDYGFEYRGEWSSEIVTAENEYDAKELMKQHLIDLGIEGCIFRVREYLYGDEWNNYLWEDWVVKEVRLWKQKSYLMSTGEENIEVGKTYYFGELLDHEVNPGELLFSGSIAAWDEETEDWKAVYFKIEEVELNEKDYLETLVKVIGIY